MGGHKQQLTGRPPSASLIDRRAHAAAATQPHQRSQWAWPRLHGHSSPGTGLYRRRHHGGTLITTTAAAWCVYLGQWSEELTANRFCCILYCVYIGQCTWSYTGTSCISPHMTLQSTLDSAQDLQYILDTDYIQCLLWHAATLNVKTSNQFTGPRCFRLWIAFGFRYAVQTKISVIQQQICSRIVWQTHRVFKINSNCCRKDAREHEI